MLRNTTSRDGTELEAWTPSAVAPAQPMVEGPAKSFEEEGKVDTLDDLAGLERDYPRGLRLFLIMAAMVRATPPCENGRRVDSAPAG